MSDKRKPGGYIDRAALARAVRGNRSMAVVMEFLTSLLMVHLNFILLTGIFLLQEKLQMLQVVTLNGQMTKDILRLH